MPMQWSEELSFEQKTLELKNPWTNSKKWEIM